MIILSMFERAAFRSTLWVNGCLQIIALLAYAPHFLIELQKINFEY